MIDWLVGIIDETVIGCSQMERDLLGGEMPRKAYVSRKGKAGGSVSEIRQQGSSSCNHQIKTGEGKEDFSEGLEDVVQIRSNVEMR
jgi:hypothetical protein